MQPQLGTAEYSKQLLSQAQNLGVTGAGVNALSTAVGFNPTQAPGQTPVIAVDQLGGGQPVQVPTPQTGTAVSDINTVARTPLEIASSERETSLKALQDQISTVRDLQSQALDVTKSVAQLEEDAGIALKAERATNYTNQLEALERAELNAIRALESQVMSPEGKAQAQAAIQRQYAFQKADVALLQSAANRDLLTAQSIVDRKIQLQMEPLKMALDFEQQWLSMNWDLFSKSEQREWQAKVQEDERAYREKERVVEGIENISLKAAMSGASATAIRQISQAKTVQEAITIATPYLNPAPVGGGDTGSNTTVDNWARRIIDGTANLSSVPIAIRSAVVNRAAELAGEGTASAAVENPTQFLKDNLSQAELKKLSDWAGTSRWWRPASGDINEFFSKAEPDQLSKIAEALNEGYSVEEITNFLR